MTGAVNFGQNAITSVGSLQIRAPEATAALFDLIADDDDDDGDGWRISAQNDTATGLFAIQSSEGGGGSRTFHTQLSINPDGSTNANSVAAFVGKVTTGNDVAVTGTVTATSFIGPATAVAADAVTEAMMADDAIGAAQMKTVQSFRINDSGGNSLFLMHGAGA